MQSVYNIISIIVIGILAIALVANKGCGRGQVVEEPQKETIRVDTVEKEIIRIDTFHQTKIVYLQSPEKPQVSEVIVDETTSDTTSIYSGTQQDSVMSINYVAAVRGELDNLSLSYVHKGPREIVKYIDREVIETVRETVSEYKNGFYIGSTFGFNRELQRASIAPTITLTTKNNLMVSYNYDIISRSHGVGLSYRLIPKR